MQSVCVCGCVSSFLAFIYLRKYGNSEVTGKLLCIVQICELFKSNKFPELNQFCKSPKTFEVKHISLAKCMLKMTTLKNGITVGKLIIDHVYFISAIALEDAE